MSELKAIRSGEIYDIIEYEDCYRTDDLYYPKSEADKVIAEKDAEIRRLRLALWTTRANMAKAEADRWESHVDCGNLCNRKDPAFVKTGKRLGVTDWRILWSKNERRCRAKAEEYR